MKLSQVALSLGVRAGRLTLGVILRVFRMPHVIVTGVLHALIGMMDVFQANVSKIGNPKLVGRRSASCAGPDSRRPPDRVPSPW